MLLIIVAIIQALCGVALILTVLFQSGSKEGLGVIGGASESFMSKNKSKTLDSKLQKFTIVIGILFAITTILLNVIILGQ